MSKLLYSKKGNGRVANFIMDRIREDERFRSMPIEAQKEFEARTHYGNYDLDESELPKFAKWMQDNKNSYWDAESYDPVVAYKAQLKKAANGHTGDLGKKPFHPTFSNESIYHQKDYNEHERGGGGAWVNAPSGNSYFAPSGTNMYFAHGFRDFEGTTGLRGRMNSQGDFYTNIVKLPRSNRAWDQEAADQENAMVRDYTGMDFDHPENSTGPMTEAQIRAGKEKFKETDRRTEARWDKYKEGMQKYYNKKRQGGILYKL